MRRLPPFVDGGRLQRPSSAQQSAYSRRGSNAQNCLFALKKVTWYLVGSCAPRLASLIYDQLIKTHGGSDEHRRLHRHGKEKSDCTLLCLCSGCFHLGCNLFLVQSFTQQGDGKRLMLYFIDSETISHTGGAEATLLTQLVEALQGSRQN